MNIPEMPTEHVRIITVEVVGPDEIIEMRIDVIIISSLDYEDIWYQELREQGIIRNVFFYWEDICAEDAVWEE